MLAIAAVLLAGGLASSVPGAGSLVGHLAGKWNPGDKTVLLLLPAGADRPEEKVLHPDAKERFSAGLGAVVKIDVVDRRRASDPDLGASDPPRSENISLGSIAVPSASPTILTYDPGPGPR